MLSFRKVFATFMLFGMIIQSNAQELSCGTVFNDEFGEDGSIPAGWTEYNSNNRVSVSDGYLTFNYASGRPGAYRTFDAVEENFTLNFTYQCSRNWHKGYITLKASDDAVITKFLMGNDGQKNFFIANTFNSSGNPIGYSDKLLDGNFSSNTDYQLSVKVDLDTKTATVFINGEQKATDIPINPDVRDFNKVDIQQYSMYGGSGITKYDYIQVMQDDINRIPLELAIESVQTFADTVAVGTGTGEFDAAAKSELDAAIISAKAVLYDCDIVQSEIEDAVADLDMAYEAFFDSRYYPSTSISITVDPATELCEKNPYWFGGNNTYNGNGQGLWNAADLHCQYDVIDMANYTGASLYRFPGGTMANLYHWKRAIGPVADRIDNMNSHGAANPLNNNFGPDEFGQMLKKTPLSRGMIVVAFDWDTPQDAADYVEYMNCKVGENPNGGIDWAQVRADNGHVEPYNVKYWEIGNELGGDWELNFINYPSSGDDKRGGDLIQKGNVSLYVNGGYRTFTNQRAVIPTSWVDTDCQVDGSANQEFYVKFAPVDLSSNFILKINNETWTRVASFNSSNSSSKHYVLDAESGKITFGDGSKGLAPSGGYNIYVDYRSGYQPGFSEYYDAMKAVDPSIHVIGCVESESFYRQMALVDQPYDGVAKHYYPSSNPATGDEYICQMKNAVNMKNKTATHLNYLQKYDNTAIKDINVQQHFSEFGVDRTISAVASLSVMWHGVVNSYSDVVASMCTHSYFKNDNTPMVNTGGKFFAPKAYAYHIFSQLHQDYFVKATYNGGSYNYNNTTIQNSYPTASINKEGNVMTIVVPNTRDKHKHQASLNISNNPFLGKSVKVKKWVVKAYDFYTMNSSAKKENIRMVGPMDIAINNNLLEDEIQPFSVAVYQIIQEDAEFLSDLTETSNAEVKKDENFMGSSDLKVNGISFSKGICAQAGTTVGYSLNGQYTHFIGEVGLDDAYTGGSAQLDIYVNNVLTYSTPVMESNTPNEKLMIDVVDADEIRFEVNTGGIGNGDDYLVMGDARFAVIGGNIPSGVEDEEVNIKLDVFPNPFKDQLNVQLPDDESGTIEIRDGAGKLIFSKLFRNQSTIHLNDIPNGTYGIYIMVIKTSAQTYVSKIVRE